MGKPSGKIKLKCDYCGKEFEKKPSEIGKHNFCKKECFKLARSTSNIFKKGCDTTCLVCGSSFYTQPRNIGKVKFCSVVCMGKWYSENLIGERASNYKNALLDKECLVCGRIFSSYHKKQKYCSSLCMHIGSRKRLILCCHNCGKNFERTESELKWATERGQVNTFCSQECSIGYNKGENHPNYIEDRSTIKNRDKSIRQSTEMKTWRESVFKRDDYTCKLCNNKHTTLNAHHIKRYIDEPHLRFDPDNGITLCVECHRKTYKKEHEYEPIFLEMIC